MGKSNLENRKERIIIKRRVNKWVSVALLMFLVILCNLACGKKTENNVPEDSISNVKTESENDVETEVVDQVDERIELAETNGTPTIVISNVNAKPGEKVKVAARIVNNPGVLGMSVTLSYDESVLELLSVEGGDAFADILDMTHSENLGNGCIFLWDGQEITPEQVKDGDFLIMEFQVSKDSAAAKCPIMLISDEGGTVDNDLQPLDIAIENGFITISE